MTRNLMNRWQWNSEELTEIERAYERAAAEELLSEHGGGHAAELLAFGARLAHALRSRVEHAEAEAEAKRGRAKKPAKPVSSSAEAPSGHRHKHDPATGLCACGHQRQRAGRKPKVQPPAEVNGSPPPVLPGQTAIPATGVPDAE